MINLPDSFLVTTDKPIDTRLVLTKAEMKSQIDARMPDVYMAICKDDGKLYLYNKQNDIDEELGKFRVYEADISDNDLSVKLPGALRIALDSQEANSGLSVDCEGNIRVNLDSDFLMVDDNNHITFADFIIESGE